jgi:hypothetical protein
MEADEHIECKGEMPSICHKSDPSLVFLDEICYNVTSRSEVYTCLQGYSCLLE